MIKTAAGWQCSNCGHNLQVDWTAQMELALKLSDLPGDTFSGAGMTPQAMALYIRRLELRWVRDQQDLRLLRRQLDLAGLTPATEYLQAV